MRRGIFWGGGGGFDGLNWGFWGFEVWLEENKGLLERSKVLLRKNKV